MQAINRQYGRITHKGAGDDAKCAVLLQDYANSEQVLTQIIEASKHWRDAWIQTLGAQVRMVESFAELYNPVVGSSGEGSDRSHILTPELQLSRTSNLVAAYTELRTDLLSEVAMVDTRIIKPANDALIFIKPIKKTIKNRENKRLDYEGALDKLENRRRTQKTEKDEMAVLKLETDAHKAADDFQAADQHLKQTLPSIIASTFSLLPHLLAALTSIQTSLLAQYYTTLHNFCLENSMPSPPPPVEDVLGQWEREFTPIQQEVEAQRMIRTGKAILLPLHPVEDGSRRQGGTLTGMNLRNRGAAAGSGLVAKGKTMTGRGDGNAAAQSPSIGNEPPTMQSGSRTPSGAYGQYQQENRQPSPVQQYQPAQQSYSPNPHHAEEERAPSYNHIQRPNPVTTQSANSIAAGKKKPPPPPPMKRIQSKPEQYVTAIYAFEGQESGDLSFNEGDRIKVVKKTESTDDWWDGELSGRIGRFPANYVEL